MKLIFVFLSFFIFSCMAQPPQVINSPVINSTINPSAQATIPPSLHSSCNPSFNSLIPAGDFGKISGDPSLKVESVTLPYQNLGISVGLWTDPYLTKDRNSDPSLVNQWNEPFKAKVKLSDGSVESNVDWYSSDNCIVSASNDGKLRGYKGGTAIITAVSKRDYTKMAKLKVVVYSNNYQPVWSPKADKIAFLSDKEGSLQLFTMNKDGSNQKRISFGPIFSNYNFKTITWSPDGSQILFEAQLNGKFGIYLVNSDGSNLREITVSANVINSFAVWSPDGRKIAFKSEDGNYQSGKYNLYLVNSDGSNLTKIISSQYFSNFKWSPDSNKIAYINEVSFHNKVRVIDITTQKDNELSETLSYCWSTDSKKLIFIPLNPDSILMESISDAFYSSKIEIINIDGTDRKNFITISDYLYYAAPTLSPDGKRIAFFAVKGISKIRLQDTLPDIFTISSNGSNLVNITKNTPAIDGYGNQIPKTRYLSLPVWSPDNKKISISVINNMFGRSETAVINTETFKVNYFAPIGDSWSGDSQYLVFTGPVKKGELLNDIQTSEIYTVDLESMNQLKLTNDNYLNTLKKLEEISDPPITIPESKPGNPINKSNLRTKVVYSQYINSISQILIMDVGGNNQKQLTNDNNFNNYPSLSPDGSKIAYISTIDKSLSSSINIINTDGTGLIKLTEINHKITNYPKWSPDGKKLLFISGLQVAKINVDGTEFKNLTNPNPNEFIDLNKGIGYKSNPDWSPDGKKIAYLLRGQNGDELFLMNADGTDQVNLSNNKVSYIGSFSWSPDSTRIAFYGSDLIYIINSDGTSFKNITSKLGINDQKDINPVWSPDSTKIAFISSRDGQIRYQKDSQLPSSEIYIMNPDGTGQIRLTFNSDEDYNPTWSKDSSLIYFTSGRDSVRDEKGYITEGRSNLYVMNQNGTYQTRLTDINSFPLYYFDLKE